MNERFRTLVRHFFSRYFDKDSMSSGAEPHANLVQVIAMLAVPGAILSLFTIADHPLVRSELTTMWLRAGDRYVFVCYAMTVMGFVMTFKWDSLFPDRGDYIILTPLPILLREWFAAKVVSLCAFLGSFAMAINIFSCILVPYAYAVRDNRWGVIPPAFIAHTAAVLGGSIFMALSFAAAQGVLINIMRPSQFRRASTWFQMIAMAILVAALLVTPGIAANIRPIVESGSRVPYFIPVFWFLGIYETLNPDGTLIPMAHAWAGAAVDAMLVSAALFVLTYLIGYRRYSKKVLEGIEADIFRERWHQRAGTGVLNRALLRDPRQRAVFHFIGRIFARSSKHRLFIAMYGGIGLAMVISSLFELRPGPGFALSVSQQGLMQAPLILAFFAVSGLRATFNIPYELNANWIFQIASGEDPQPLVRATRKWVLLRGVLPVCLLVAPAEVAFAGAVEAIVSLAIASVMAVLLIEVFFFNFNKVPFTCSYLPAKSHLAFLAGTYLYGFTLYTSMAASLERWVGESLVRMGIFAGVTGAVLLLGGWYTRRARRRPRKIVYEDEMDPPVRELNLV